MYWRWSGDCARVLACLPAPLFRQNDIYGVCDHLGLPYSEAQRIWRQLRVEGRIVRTQIPIATTLNRRYWERSHVFISWTLANRCSLPYLTKCQK
jgi:hypothetical protein